MKNNVWVGIELNTSAVRLISSVDESLVQGRGPCFEDKNLEERGNLKVEHGYVEV